MIGIDDLLPGLGSEDAIAALAGLAAALAVFAVWRALIERDPLATRVRAVARRAMPAPAVSPERARRSIDLVRRLLKSLVTRPTLHDAIAGSTRERLDQAGWRTPEAVSVFIAAKLGLPSLAGAGAVIALYVLELGEMTPMERMVVSLAAVMAGFYLPEMTVMHAARVRRARLRKAVPDALDLLVICTEAGSSLDAGISRVARELGPSCPDLADEFSVTAMELGFLPDRRQALENLARRTGLPSIRSVVSTLMQTEKYGTPLAQSLRVLAAEYRNERMLKAEEKAARLPTLLTVPLICFILPTLFVVLLGPAIIGAMKALQNM